MSQVMSNLKIQVGHIVCVCATHVWWGRCQADTHTILLNSNISSILFGMLLLYSIEQKMRTT